MSRKGSCWDNAAAEGPCAAFKGDLVDHADFAPRAEARIAIFGYIEVFCNRQRRRAHLGYQAPAGLEETIGKLITESA